MTKSTCMPKQRAPRSTASSKIGSGKLIVLPPDPRAVIRVRRATRAFGGKIPVPPREREPSCAYHFEHSSVATGSDDWPPCRRMIVCPTCRWPSGPRKPPKFYTHVACNMHVLRSIHFSISVPHHHPHRSRTLYSSSHRALIMSYG